MLKKKDFLLEKFKEFELSIEQTKSIRGGVSSPPMTSTVIIGADGIGTDHCTVDIAQVGFDGMPTNIRCHQPDSYGEGLPWIDESDY